MIETIIEGVHKQRDKKNSLLQCNVVKDKE